MPSTSNRPSVRSCDGPAGYRCSPDPTSSICVCTRLPFVSCKSIILCTKIGLVSIACLSRCEEMKIGYWIILKWKYYDTRVNREFRGALFLHVCASIVMHHPFAKHSTFLISFKRRLVNKRYFQRVCFRYGGLLLQKNANITGCLFYRLSTKCRRESTERAYFSSLMTLFGDRRLLRALPWYSTIIYLCWVCKLYINLYRSRDSTYERRERESYLFLERVGW